MEIILFPLRHMAKGSEAEKPPRRGLWETPSSFWGAVRYEFSYQR